MFLSNSHRFIFFSVPKTGSTSVLECLERALPDVQEAAQRLPTEGEHKHPKSWKDRRPGGARKHMSPDQLRRVLPNFDDYFSFCFMRNPWSWMVSYYHYVRARELDPVRRAQGGYPEEILLRIQVANEIDFDAWVPWFIERADARRPFGRFLFKPDGTQAVDFVGRFEHLGEDLAAVGERVGLELPALPHLNASRHGRYEDYYGAETREMVARHFAREIDLMGYRFGA